MKYPENFGKCFDAAGMTMVKFPTRAKLCHGIGVANAPGQEGRTMTHAWIELDGVAFDCIWMVKMPTEIYRQGLQVSYVVEYTKAEMWENWARTNMPGPWDEKLVAIHEEQERRKA